MFCNGSQASLTANRFAVAGISCISPCAFFGDFACGLKFDSARITASTRAGSSLYRGASVRTHFTIMARGGSDSLRSGRSMSMPLGRMHCGSPAGRGRRSSIRRACSSPFAAAGAAVKLDGVIEIARNTLAMLIALRPTRLCRGIVTVEQGGKISGLLGRLSIRSAESSE